MKKIFLSLILILIGEMCIRDRTIAERRAELEQAKQPQQRASESPKGAAPVHERPVTTKQPEDFRHHVDTSHTEKPAMQPASLSIRERGQVSYEGAVAERASVPVVKSASIHREQIPPVRTERQIAPPAPPDKPDERQKTAPTITPAAPRPSRPIQNDTAPVIPERKRAAPVVKESNFTIRRTTARKEWLSLIHISMRKSGGFRRWKNCWRIKSHAASKSGGLTRTILAI